MPDPPSGAVVIPRDDKVPLANLVARFRGIYAALLERAAHFARQQDRAGSARIGRLIFTLQGWIGSWWNGHLFRVELRLQKEPPFDPPFVDDPARLNNFCTWWVIGAPEQEALVKYLDWLGGKIRAGNFDAAGELPSFEEVAVQLEIYSAAARPTRHSLGLSARLGKGAVRKAERWYAFFPMCKRTPKLVADSVVFYRIDALRNDTYFPTASFNKSFVAPQLVPVPSQYPAHTVEEALDSLHNGVKRKAINLEAFKAWGRTWWMRLFAAHAEKAYLALWYCLTEAQRGEVIDFFVQCGWQLLSRGEQAYPLSTRRLRGSYRTRTTPALSPRGALFVLAAFEQGAVVKTSDEGYDHWPDMPDFLQSIAHSLGTSLLHNYSHRQRAIYRI